MFSKKGDAVSLYERACEKIFMLGTLDPLKKEVTIIGGGFAGLSFGWTLLEKGYDVRIFESQQHGGGLISSIRHPWGLQEAGPHCFLATPAVLSFCDRLGVRLISVQKNAKKKWIQREGRLSSFPLSVTEIGELVCRFFFMPFSREKERTLAQWGQRHLGQKATDYLLSPMIRGIFATSPETLLQEISFPHWGGPFPQTLFLSCLVSSLKKRHKKNIMAPLEGMQDIIQCLVNKINSFGQKIFYQTPITELPERGNVILTLPAYAAGPLFKKTSPELSSACENVVYAPLITVTICVKKEGFFQPLSGIGILFPEKEHAFLLGILFPSVAFLNRVPDESSDILTFLFKQNAPEDTLWEWIDKELEKIFHYRVSYEKGKIFRWEKAIPQYQKSLKNFWEIAQTHWCHQRGHLFFSNYTGQVSLRGMIETLSDPARIPFYQGR